MGVKHAKSRLKSCSLDLMGSVFFKNRIYSVLAFLNTFKKNEFIRFWHWMSWVNTAKADMS